ncbi:ABC transporter permease [Rugosimonospora africana]|uniref:Transport permease protein n=1 Tax=Rugosimonospora africana TaxID=556532 RepID=A0A8J3R0S2_9ACTN|nr:ABC transporter permease [Rugosimonospora africana]GIH19265.1 transport permease protein [Rugosimonospora africana]
MTAIAKLSATESKLFLREPIGVFFGVLFPAALILVLGSAIPGFTDPSKDLDGARPIDGYLPIMLALAIATVTMVTLVSALTGYREKGVLRRMATTPVSPSALLTAQFVVNAGALFAGSGLAYAAAAIAFHVQVPANVAGVLLAFLLGTGAMGAVALFVAAISPNTRVQAGIAAIVYYPMMFFAGVWTGPVMPHAVRRIADYTPLGAASQALQDAWVGDWPRPVHLAVMVATAALFGTAAAKLFRWE